MLSMSVALGWDCLFKQWKMGKPFWKALFLQYTVDAAWVWWRVYYILHPLHTRLALSSKNVLRKTIIPSQRRHDFTGLPTNVR